MDNYKIHITEKDYARIKSYIGSTINHDFEDLELELDRASIISDNEVPNNLATMNSKIRYFDSKSNEESIVTIVYPKDSNPRENKISVFAPLGSALIGLKQNEEINWKFPNGETKNLKILEIIYQPESAGDWHL
ncbi:MAG: nucleoside diphosphate kinase regulator [Flavobacteriaceae bacterium]|nr:nucleoside diphosphate kinase regulator [Flavobacteriaceae bacterium]